MWLRAALLLTLGGGWITFAPPGGGFSVLLPEKPREMQNTLKTPAGAIDVTFYHVELKDETALAVSVSKYPPGSLAAGDLEQRLDHARDDAVQHAKGKLKAEKKVTLAGQPGRDLLIEGEPHQVRTRLFAVGERLFQTTVVGTKKQIEAKEAAQFLDSFQLVK